MSTSRFGRFRRWLLDTPLHEFVQEDIVDRVREPLGQVVDAQVYDALMRLCAHYLVNEKAAEMPLDPVARFHLGNGAQLYRINGAADLSAMGRVQSAGIMVNYMYHLPSIEENHERFFDQGRTATSRAVFKLID